MIFRKISRCQGITLVETLIAIVVLAIGLLGMAGLQMTGLMNTRSAYQRAQATMLAYDMADRMRANSVGFRAGNYNNPTAQLTAGCLTTAGCSPAELAGHDAAEWAAALGAALPSGGGVVCLDDSPEDGSGDNPACDNSGSVYAIKIWWDENHSDRADQMFIMSFRP